MQQDDTQPQISATPQAPIRTVRQARPGMNGLTLLLEARLMLAAALAIGLFGYLTLPETQSTADASQAIAAKSQEH